jgi:nicotinamidase/pyrazinamidase
MPVALIGVDFQVDFATPDGGLYVPDGMGAVGPFKALRAGLGSVPVFLTQDSHPADHVSFAANHPGKRLFETVVLASGESQVLWPRHCVTGSAGAEFVAGVAAPTDVVVPKGRMRLVDSYSGFGSADGVTEITSLYTELEARRITHLVIGGLAFDYCVAYTARDATRLGYKVCVVRSASRAVAASSALHEEALMLATGVVIVEDVAAALAWAESGKN